MPAYTHPFSVQQLDFSLFVIESLVMSVHPALFPHFFSGKVVHGFGRGGKDLSCPTANLDESTVAKLPSDFPQGVFWGMARVNGGEVYPMVMSVGTNPHFNGQKKTMEVHVIHEYPGDFYDSKVDGLMLGFIREMKSFDGLDSLIIAIQNDINTAKSEYASLPAKEEHIQKYFKN